MIVNGKHYDWGDVTIILPGMGSEGIIGIQSVDWNEEKEIEAVYGKGDKPIGYGTGNWKADGKITLTLEAFRDLNRITPEGIFNAKPFNMVINFANNDEDPHTVVLKGCKFNKKSNKAAQGDKKFETELEFLILDDVVTDGISANNGKI